MFVERDPLLCGLFLYRKYPMASVVCLGAHDTNAGRITSLAAFRGVHERSPLGFVFFYHLDEEVAPELFVLVTRLQTAAVGLRHTPSPC